MFNTLAGRREHTQELSRMLAEVAKARTAALWLAQLQGGDVPFELCVTPRAGATSDHVVAIMG